jgi:hypothetical protein
MRGRIAETGAICVGLVIISTTGASLYRSKTCLCIGGGAAEALVESEEIAPRGIEVEIDLDRAFISLIPPNSGGTLASLTGRASCS